MCHSTFLVCLILVNCIYGFLHAIKLNINLVSGKPVTGQITGLFGKEKPPSSQTETKSGMVI